MDLTTYIDIKAKCHHLKILTRKGTLRQVFIRVYGLENEDAVSHVGIFDHVLWTVAPLTFSLVQSPSFPVWSSILYNRIQCVRGGGGCIRFWASDRLTPAAKVNFLRWRHFALPSMSVIFLRFCWDWFPDGWGNPPARWRSVRPLPATALPAHNQRRLVGWRGKFQIKSNQIKIIYFIYLRYIFHICLMIKIHDIGH